MKKFVVIMGLLGLSQGLFAEPNGNLSEQKSMLRDKAGDLKTQLNAVNAVKDDATLAESAQTNRNKAYNLRRQLGSVYRKSFDLKQKEKMAKADEMPKVMTPIMPPVEKKAANNTDFKSRLNSTLKLKPAVPGKIPEEVKVPSEVVQAEKKPLEMQKVPEMEDKQVRLDAALKLKQVDPRAGRKALMDLEKEGMERQKMARTTSSISEIDK